MALKVTSSQGSTIFTVPQSYLFWLPHIQPNDSFILPYCPVAHLQQEGRKQPLGSVSPDN